MPLSLQPISLDRQHSLSLARQLYVQLHQQILHGELIYGERLPATRELAKALSIARGVVVDSYEMLKSDGLVAGFGKGGTQVCYVPTSQQRSTQMRKATLHLSVRGQRIAHARHYGQAEQPLPLTPSVPDMRLFPFKRWQALAKESQQAPTWYQRHSGLLLLKEQLALYLAHYRGIRLTDLNHLLITTGTQASLSALAQLLANEGDCAVLEAFSWSGAHAALQQAGLKVVHADLDAEGMVLEPWLQLEPQPRLAIVTPSVQFPTGLAMSVQRREALLQQTAQRGIWVIEDDYAAEYSYAQHPPPSLLAHSRTDSVIHVGTMSKLLFPGLRLGWLVVPASIAKDINAALNTFGLQPAYALQYQLARFLQYGYLSHHLALTRSVYNQRRSACAAYFNQQAAQYVEVTPSISGMNLYLRLLKPIYTSAALQARFKTAGLGAEVYQRHDQQYVLIGHANLDETQMQAILARFLATLLH